MAMCFGRNSDISLHLDAHSIHQVLQLVFQVNLG